MTRLEDFKKCVDGSGGVITFTNPTGSHVISYTPGKFTIDGNGYGCVNIYPPYNMDRMEISSAPSTIIEFNDRTLEQFIESNSEPGSVFDEKTDMERYLSYQPTYEPKTIDEVEDIMAKRYGGYFFEHNGFEYCIKKDKTGISTRGPMEKYRTNHSTHIINDRLAVPITTINPERFGEFITAYTLDGTPLKTALENQKKWKYLCNAKILVRELRGEEYNGVYKGMPFFIHEDGEFIGFNSENALAKRNHNTPELGFEHKEDTYELLGKVFIDGKSLREIFDTEYDDGETLHGYHGV